MAPSPEHWNGIYGARAEDPLCQGSCPLLYFSLFLRWAG